MTTEKRGRVYIPESVDKDLLESVKKSLADEYGGYTVLDGRGGWVNECKETIEENVRVVEVCGDELTGERMKAMSRWLAHHSDEDAVMWDIQPITYGLETSEDSAL